ncbi:MAG: hypothetical protein G01um101493_283 [Microgenomates group bacterium Gr01-1014_93]|nr:MAG: hypothetical protein G01um101493_283 [Microgenomates group bacterium Gr01-1014_93]
MLKNISENTFIHILLLIIVAIFTFFPALEMFFYLDEWGNLYEFTHGNFKYSHFTTRIMHLLYRLFGIDATGWFGVGIVVFALSVVAFYFFVRLLLKNKVLALVAGLIYATTPVGTNTVTMIWTFVAEGGYPLNIALVVLLYTLLKYFQERKIFYYLFVVVAFMVFLELEPRRVFIFLPILILFDYLINFKKIIPNVGFMARAFSLVTGFVAYYKYDVSLSKIISTGSIVLADQTGYDWQTKLRLGIESPFHIQPLVTLTNILLGGPWVFLSELLKEYINPSDVKQIYLLVVIVLFFAVALVVLAWKTKREWGLTALFSLGWIYLNIWSFYVFSSPGISDTAHRTLSIAAPAYALFMAISGFALYTFLKKRKSRFRKNLNSIFVLAFVFLLGVNFLATRYNFNKFNDFRSRPARAFFKDLKNFYPTLPANSLLYFQTPENPQIKYRLSRIYGGNNYGAGATIAVFYPELKKEEINVTREYKDVEKFVENDLAKIDRVFTFYFDEKGLSNKTVDIRSNLKQATP